MTDPIANLAIVLVRPQLAQNVGMTARAMANCGVVDLRLVTPRFAWHDRQAQAEAQSSAGRNSKIAHKVLNQAQVFSDLPSALADLQRVWATSARTRDVAVPQTDLQEAMAEVVLAQEKNLRTGILFGPERTGLDNDEMVFAEARVFIPLAEGATSLNLAQAVLLTCWEWLQAQHAAEAIPHTTPATERSRSAGRRESPARREVLDGFLTRLETELIAADYYPPTETAETMRRNLRAFFARSHATAQEIQSLEGMLRALAARRALRSKKTD